MSNYVMVLGFMHDLVIDFKRLGNKISEFIATYTDNVFAGTIFFFALLFLSYAYIRSHSKK